MCNGTLFTVEKTLPQAGLTRSIGQRSPTELPELLPIVGCHMVSNVHVRQSFETMYMLSSTFYLGKNMWRCTTHDFLQNNSILLKN